MILLIDIGNTRLKWAQLEAGALGEQHAATHTSANRASMFESLFATTPRPERVLISNVGGPAIGQLCSALIEQRWQLRPELIVSQAQAAGVRNAYREPAKLGVDRWLSMIAAHAMAKRAACIVSVGTAMTIDVIDASGAHLGGVIVPGPQLMISSLLQNTSDIGPRMSPEQSEGSELLARDTGAAVRQGCAHALASLVVRAVEESRARLGVAPALVLTGGASDTIAPLIGIEHERVADLVLRGLAVIAGEGAVKSGE